MKEKLSVIVFAAVLLLLSFLLPAVSVPAAAERDFVVIIDPGHGGDDGGAVSISGKCEKDFNLDLSLRLSEALENAGIKTVLTRTEDRDTDGEEGFHKRKDILERLAFTEKYPDSLFVSVHMNSSTSENDKGFQVFYGTKNGKSKLLAEKIHSEISLKAYTSRLREVKQTPDSVYIMKNSEVPSVLVECGFISNKTDENLLSDPEYRQSLAFVLASAISDFVKEKAA